MCCTRIADSISITTRPSRQYIPAEYIYPEYNPAVLDAVFARQKKILNNPALTEEEKDKRAPFFVLLDDVISDQRLKYDRNIMEVCSNSGVYLLLPCPDAFLLQLFVGTL
jgi:hypothetical protein